MTSNNGRSHIQNSFMYCDRVQPYQCHIYSTYICVIKKIALYSWNRSVKVNKIAIVDTMLWQYRLLIWKCPLKRVYVKDFECIHNTKYAYQHILNFWTRTEVIMRKHNVHPTGFGVYSSTCFTKMDRMGMILTLTLCNYAVGLLHERP